MNFKLSELNEWYDTRSGTINSKIIIKSIKKISYINQNKTILYFGPEKIVKKIIDNSYNFNSFYISHSGNTDVKSELQRLPFKDSIIDCVVLIHSLDVAEDPHSVFREIDRVLADDGQIIVAGFNKNSLLGIYKLLPFKTIFKNKNYLCVKRLCDWISLFSYELNQIFNINKIPPVTNNNLLKYLKFLNNNIFSKINFFGISYVVHANKKTYRYISVKNWHKKNNIVIGKFSKPVIHSNYEE